MNFKLIQMGLWSEVDVAASLSQFLVILILIYHVFEVFIYVRLVFMNMCSKANKIK